MRRRALLLALGGAAAGGAAAGAQTPGQDSARGAADPLPRPDWIPSTRAEVRAADNDETVKAIERKLRCTCPCGLDIFTCRTTDFTCTYSPALHQEVVALLQAGRSPDQVVEDFVAKYGESILLAPKPRGFGTLGYVLPGALIVAAGSLLAWVLARRSSVPTPSPSAAGAPAPAGPAARPEAARPPGGPARPAGAPSPDEVARLERALRELDA
jgi:cytochrome c-type biogenesis protein CcmH